MMVSVMPPCFLGQVVEFLPAYLDSGVHRGDLVLLSQKAGQQRFQCCPIRRDGTGLQRGAGDVLGVRHLAEPQTGYIFLLAVLCELHPAGGLPHKDRQHPGGHGVQRSAVSHPLFVEDAPHLGADVHAGPTGGLVDNQDTTGHKNLLKGSRTRPAQR